MDKGNKNNPINNIHHFLSSKSKHSKNNSSKNNSKKNISEINENILTTSNYGKRRNENDFSLFSNNKQNNTSYNNIQSSISLKTEKPIFKSNINNSPKMLRKKNFQKKNFLNAIIYRSISQNSNERSDYSYSSLLKKETESQDLLSPINKKYKSDNKILFNENKKQKNLIELLKTQNQKLLKKK